MTLSKEESAWVSDVLATMVDEALLQAFAKGQANLEAQQRFVGHVEQECYRRMKARGATAIPDNTFICELVEGRPTLKFEVRDKGESCA